MKNILDLVGLVGNHLVLLRQSFTRVPRSSRKFPRFFVSEFGGHSFVYNCYSDRLLK